MFGSTTQVGSTQALGGMPRSQINVRSISEAEALVLERALALAAVDPSAADLLSQVRTLQVIGRCGCGCASVDFQRPAPGQLPSIVADAVAKGPNGEHMGLIVWALEDRVSGLEVYNFSEDSAPLPVLDSICSYESAGSVDAT